MSRGVFDDTSSSELAVLSGNRTYQRNDDKSNELP